MKWNNMLIQLLGVSLIILGTKAIVLNNGIKEFVIVIFGYTILYWHLNYIEKYSSNAKNTSEETSNKSKKQAK